VAAIFGGRLFAGSALPASAAPATRMVLGAALVDIPSGENFKKYQSGGGLVFSGGATERKRLIRNAKSASGGFSGRSHASYWREVTVR